MHRKAGFVLVMLMIAGIFSMKGYAQDPGRYYEMRIYYAASGKLSALEQRFREHTTKLFEKHGMENVGYWTPVVNEKENSLYYILSYPSKEARQKSWQAFGADPEWTKVKSASETNGKLVDSVKSIFMTDAGLVKGVQSQKQHGVYELRIYYCLAGRLPNLITRFKDHTLKLFEKQGMTNVVYFVTESKNGEQPQLLYLLGHKNPEAAAASWKGFLADPDWVKARDNSEKDGKIVDRITSEMLISTDFSKIR